MTERQENLSKNTQVDRGQTDITPVPENDERKEAINTQAKEGLKTLKEEIESGVFGPAQLAEHLKIAENIKTNPEKQALYVGSIFGALNKAGFAIQKINGNKISLLRPYIGRGIAKNHGNDIDLYQNILNTSNFDTKVLHKALLYRTSGIEEYSKMLDNKASVDGYALYLVKQHPQLEKYIIIENGNIVFKVQDQETYTRFKLQMREQIQSHPADADFLVAYFDNIFYKGRVGNKFLEDTTFQEYKTEEEKGKKEMMKLFNTNFSSEQLYSLGIKDANGMDHLSRQMRHDPVGTSGQLLRDGIVGGLGAGVLLGILGYFFGGKAGFFGGLTLGLVGGAAGGKLGWNAIQDMFLGEKSAKEKSLYQAYKDIVENRSEEYQNTLAETLSNTRFLSSDAKTTLNIFTTEDVFEKRQEYFKNKLGIDLTTENEVMYKDLFKAILKKQADNHITPQENESMATFLDRKIADSNVNTSAGAATGAAAVGAESSEVKKDEEKVEVSIESQNSQKEYSEEEKTEILQYFNINNPELLKNLKILGLNPFGFLKNYKTFIETNLYGFEHKNTIILSIQAKLNAVQEKIEELKQQELDNYGDLNQFKNNRWIVNSLIIDLFKQTNTQVLPGAYLLQNKDKISLSLKFSSSKDKFSELEKMFEADLTDDGDFDKTWLSFEIIDANTNKWNIFNTQDDINIFQQAGWKAESLTEISLLNEQDKDIEDEANLAYLLYVGVSVLPFVGLGASLPSDVADALSDEEGVIFMLKQYGLINENYRTDKSYIDNILGFAGIALSVFGFQALAKGKKVAKAAEISQNIDPVQAEKVALKMGINKETLDTILSYFKKGKTSNTPVDVTDGGRAVNVAENATDAVTPEHIADALEKNRAAPNNNGLPTGEFAKYQNRYSELYEQLNSIGIHDNATRGIEIKKLDLEIATEISNAAKVSTDVATGARTVNAAENVSDVATGSRAAENVSDMASLGRRDLQILNKHISTSIDAIPVGETKTIGGVSIKRIGENEFYYKLANGKSTIGSKSQLLKDNIIDVNKVNDELLKSNNFKGLIKETNLHRIKNINGHKVRFRDGNIEVMKGRILLEGDELNNFVKTNFTEILRSYGINGTHRIPPNVKNQIHSAQQWLEKNTALNKGDKIKENQLRFLLSEISKPLRGMLEILDSLVNASSKKDKANDILKILVLGDRSKVWLSKDLGENYGRLAFSAALASGVTLFESDDDLGSEEIIDIMLYNTLGSLWVLGD